MKIFCLMAVFGTLHISSHAQNRRTTQWSYSIPFTNPSVTMPLSFVKNKKNDNHIIEWQCTGILPSFWYHSKSRFGVDVGAAFISYSSYDAFFKNWVNENSDGVYHPYYYLNRDYNFQANAFLTYYISSIHTWNFHGFAGYAFKFLRWRIPEGIYDGYLGSYISNASGERLYSYQKLYRISAQQVNANYNYRIGINAVHNGYKRLVVLKCWYDLQPPARIEYRIEEISPNGGLDIRESRKLDWFASVGVGIEIHGFLKSKQEENIPQADE